MIVGRIFFKASKKDLLVLPWAYLTEQEIQNLLTILWKLNKGVHYTFNWNT